MPFANLINGPSVGQVHGCITCLTAFTLLDGLVEAEAEEFDFKGLGGLRAEGGAGREGMSVERLVVS